MTEEIKSLSLSLFLLSLSLSLFVVSWGGGGEILEKRLMDTRIHGPRDYYVTTVYIYICTNINITTTTTTKMIIHTHTHTHTQQIDYHDTNEPLPPPL